jgi:carbonic anhydrase
MRLFEAIVEANHRAVAGDADAGLHPGDFAEELPVVALTCLDPRLNAFFPNALALPADQFVWLRNAGNVIAGPLSGALRSLALACAVHGGREIAVIGHSDCHFCKITALQLLDRFKELGVERSVLPENLNEFFGLFGNEPQNVLNTCDVLRRCPWIGPKIPVHGLLLNLENGKLDWLVNGYQALETMAGRLHEPINPAGPMPDLLKSMAPFQLGEMKFPETANWPPQQQIGWPRKFKRPHRRCRKPPPRRCPQRNRRQPVPLALHHLSGPHRRCRLRRFSAATSGGVNNHLAIMPVCRA